MSLDIHTKTVLVLLEAVVINHLVDLGDVPRHNSRQNALISLVKLAVEPCLHLALHLLLEVFPLLASFLCAHDLSLLADDGVLVAAICVGVRVKYEPFLKH